MRHITLSALVQTQARHLQKNLQIRPRAFDISTDCDKAASRNRSCGCGRIAQLVEQLTLNQRVIGSIPIAPTIFFKGLTRIRTLWFLPHGVATMRVAGRTTRSSEWRNHPAAAGEESPAGASVRGQFSIQLPRSVVMVATSTSRKVIESAPKLTTALPEPSSVTVSWELVVRPVTATRYIRSRPAS